MWYYSNNDQSLGPVEEAEIVSLLQNRSLSAESLVWRDGMPGWVALAQTDLSRYLNSVSPPSAMAPLAPLAPTTVGANPYQAPQTLSPDAYFGGMAVAAPLTWKQIFWSFEGRIPRRTYWAATLIQLAILFALMIPFASIGDGEPGAVVVLLGIVPYMWSSLAVQTKRWHDRGKSGLMVLINLIPFGGIWSFIECGCLRGSVGSNLYGSDPT